ncbi:hypothetical protein BJV77DRAFT_579144 [Russula vinacea]|nr:hypothetical protein BJV77DRAFT_579144 [Russula vinacea]
MSPSEPSPSSFFQRLDKKPFKPSNEDTSHPNARDFAVDVLKLNTALPLQLAEMFNASIAINSTAFEWMRVVWPRRRWHC